MPVVAAVLAGASAPEASAPEASAAEAAPAAALMSGANVSMTGGATGLLPLLHAAAALGHGEVVSRLIEAGAPVDARDGEGWTALQARVPLLTSRALEPFLPPPCCPAAALQLRSAARAARCGRGAAAGGARLRTGLG